LGIYSSAISVSEDSKLRQSIRNFAIKDSRLLDSIGTAHMEQEIQKRVLELTKQNQDRMAEESGIQSSLTEEDMKEYLQQVIEEVKKDRRRP
jgi:Tfp pilus assembly PilM family ATPase